MSYKCRYQLTIIQGNLDTQEVGQALEAEFGKPDYPADWYDVLNRYPVDWEKHEGQLLEISTKWPEAVLALDITGEDDFEVTREYYQNCRMYQATQPPMPRFDPRQLR